VTAARPGASRSLWERWLPAPLTEITRDIDERIARLPTRLNTYGFDPFRTDKADAQRGVHGNDERVSVANVGFGVRFLYDVLRYAQ
jgi:hypothetical protein